MRHIFLHRCLAMLLTVASASERSLPARATEGQKLGHLVEKAKDSGLTAPDAIKAKQTNQPQGRPVELLGDSACQAENKQLKSELAALKSKHAALEGIVAKTLKDSEQSAQLGHSLGEKLLSGGQESAAVTEYVWSLERRLRLVAEQPQDFACSVATKLKDTTCKQRKGTLAKKTPDKKTDRGDSHASDPERSVQECERVDTNGKSTWETRKCHKHCQGGCDNRRPIAKGAKIAKAKKAGKKSRIEFLYDGCDEAQLRLKCTGCIPSRPVLVPASRDGKVGRCYFKRSFEKGIQCQSEYGGSKIDPKRPFNCIKRAYVSTNFYMSDEQKAQLRKAKLPWYKLKGDWSMTDVTCEVKKQVTCDGSVPKQCANKKEVSCAEVCPRGHKRKGKHFSGTRNRRSKGKCLKGAKGCLPSMCTTIGSAE